MDTEQAILLTHQRRHPMIDPKTTAQREKLPSMSLSEGEGRQNAGAPDSCTDF